MRKYLLYLLLSLILTPMTVYAVKSCDTPIKCYEQAIRQYEDALVQLEHANDKVKALTTEAEKNAKSISDLNQQYQARFEELKSQLAQQEQKLATKAEADTANSAVSKADAAQGTANTAVSKADTAQGTANTAVSKADAAQGAANTAVSKADAAQGTANTAVSKADAAQGTANTAVSRVGTIGQQGKTVEVMVDAGVWGDWKGWKFCPQRTYACGAQIRFEAQQGEGDDTAMNGLMIACCPF